MNESESKKAGWKAVGIIGIVLAIIAAWFFGFFAIVFYLLGLYAALYILSIIFKTTKILEWFMGAGGILMWLLMTVGGLFLAYLFLKIMFEGSFLLGLALLVFGLPIAEVLFYGILAALAMPLVWMTEDLERRFNNVTVKITETDLYDSK
jgi:hypothetical protein